jgi:hypothetical protein
MRYERCSQILRHFLSRFFSPFSNKKELFQHPLAISLTPPEKAKQKRKVVGMCSQQLSFRSWNDYGLWRQRMIEAPKGGVLLVIALAVFASPQNNQQASKPRPAAEMERLAKMLVGTWKVDEDWAVGGTLRNGGKGTAHSVIRPGPGGLSLIEDFVGKAEHLHILYWWDKAAKSFKAIQCDDLSGEGCSTTQDQDGRGQWEGNEVVWHLTIEKDGKKIPAKIVWAEKDSRSFAATMYVADANGTLKRDWTFLHIRVK